MPSVATNPALQIKGYNPYARATLNQGQAPAFEPDRQVSRTPAGRETGNSFQAFGVDAYQTPATRSDVTSITANNVSYRVLGDLNIKVPYAQLDLYDRTPEDAMHLEGLDFNLHLRGGQVKVSDVDVSITVGKLLDQYKLPVKDLRVAFDPDNQVRVEAKVSKFGLSIPVSATATVGATPSGGVQAALGKIRVMGIPMNGLMKTFGISLEKTLKLNDPSKGFYAVGNTVYISPNQILAQPGINVNLRQVDTHLGNLSLTFADSPSDWDATRENLSRHNLNALEIRGGHFYYDGYFVKDGVVRMEDKTPGTPLEMEKDGETIMNLSQGMVGVTEYKFAEMIRGKLGNDSSLKYPTTTLKAHAAELDGLMWGAIPLKLDLAFGATAGGQLMFTPGNAKAFGFVPLPDGLIRKQVVGMVEGGIPYGKGVALPSLGDTHLGHLRQVSHQRGYLILEAGQPPAGYPSRN
jgi:hypothetical protein